jgi:hypothetical protein
MKTFNDFVTSELEEFVESEMLELTDEPLQEGSSIKANDKKQMDPPAVLVMRRKSIRQFPNNQRVALYYVDKIHKYVTVPYTAMQWSASVEEDVEYGSILDDLQNIVETNSSKTVMFEDGQTMRVDVKTANKIVKVFNVLTEENKEKVSEMAQKSKTEFNKVVDFVYNHLK